MAKQIKLSAQTRDQIGRTAVNKIKSSGLVPAVIYGGKTKPQPLQLSEREISKVLSHAVGEHVLVELQIADGAEVTNRLALIKEVQHGAVKRDILHVDFHAVSADEKLHSEVPVETTGEAFGVKNNGGILELNLHSIEVECLPKDLPEMITIDVSKLAVGDAIHIKDLVLPAGVSTRTNPELTVVHVAAPKVEAEPVAGEAAAQPEVLKEKKDDAATDKK